MKQFCNDANKHKCFQNKLYLHSAAIKPFCSKRTYVSQKFLLGQIASLKRYFLIELFYLKNFFQYMPLSFSSLKMQCSKSALYFFSILSLS